MSNDLQAGSLSLEWQERLAASAKEQAAAEKAAGNFFSTKGGTLSFQNMMLPGNKMEVIVLVGAHENVFYGAKFDANAPTSPLCYAYSFDGAGMVPHDEADARQAPACGQCRNLAWGTGDGGKGKACRELRRLCVIPASAAASIDAVMTATAGLLRVPIMSVKNWVTYVNTLATKALPTFAVICEISLVPDPKSMFRIEFKPLRTIEDTAILGALVERIAREKQTMMSPYPKRVQAGAAPVAQPYNSTQQAPSPYAAAAPMQPVPPTVIVPPQQPAAATPAAAPAFGAPPPPGKF
jgi:hypothetical protein